MRTSRVTSRSIAWVVVFLLLAQTASATTYMSIEPVPSIDIVGADDLAAIRGIGYANLELWSKRLLNDCHVVESVVNALLANAAISSVRLGINTRVVVAAGGFEGRTNPSFVFTVTDSGAGSVTESDVNVLGNALGYVLNQGSTAHFSPDNFKAYAFALDFAVVTFPGALGGLDAKEFFDYLGTIDAALWSGQFAGFTQIAFQGSLVNNSMLFLKPAASKHRFIAGLSEAARTTPGGATYFPVKNNNEPTTTRAGIAFPGNDWISFPRGEQYLSQLGNPSSQLLAELREMRDTHLQAVTDLVQAIVGGTLPEYLGGQFACPIVD
jgi:hypothetical protein